MATAETTVRGSDGHAQNAGSRSSGVGQAARRLRTETKGALKTTEFWGMVGLIVAILASAALIKGGDSGGTDEFIARQAWLYVAILGGAYFISRGLAKAGSSDPYDDEPKDGSR